MRSFSFPTRLSHHHLDDTADDRATGLVKQMGAHDAGY